MARQTPCLESQFEALRNELTKQSSFNNLTVNQLRLVEQAGLEAKALAWTTSAPWLVLPELFAEKVENVLAYIRRQQMLLNVEMPAQEAA